MDVKIALVVLCVMSLYFTQSTGETLESVMAEIDKDDVNTKMEDNFDGVNKLEGKRKSLGQTLQMSEISEKRRNAMNIYNRRPQMQGKVAVDKNSGNIYNGDRKALHPRYNTNINNISGSRIQILDARNNTGLVMGKQSRQKGSYKSIKKIIRGQDFTLKLEIIDLRDEENTPEHLVHSKGEESLEEEIEPEDLPVIKVHVKHI